MAQDVFATADVSAGPVSRYIAALDIDHARGAALMGVPDMSTDYGPVPEMGWDKRGADRYAAAGHTDRLPKSVSADPLTEALYAANRAHACLPSVRGGRQATAGAVLPSSSHADPPPKESADPPPKESAG